MLKIRIIQVKDIVFFLDTPFHMPGENESENNARAFMILDPKPVRGDRQGKKGL